MSSKHLCMKRPVPSHFLLSCFVVAYEARMLVALVACKTCHVTVAVYAPVRTCVMTECNVCR